MTDWSNAAKGREMSRGVKVFTVVFFAFMSITGIAVAIYDIYDSRQQAASQHEIDVHGVVAKGRVVNAFQSSGKNYHSYRVEYYFLDNHGQTLNGQSPVTSLDYDDLHSGDTVDVEYVPGHNSLHRLKLSTEKENIGTTYTTDAFILVVCGFVLPCIGYVCVAPQK